MSAGSLLGVALHNEVSFPVGKVEFVDLHPLDFSEYLLANGEEQLLGLIKNRDWKLVATFREKYKLLLKSYYYVGGMPEAVKAKIRAGPYNEDYDEVRAIQKAILEAYELDFSKHAPSSVVPRIRMLWNSVLAQLGKENKKFIYGQIKEGARAKDYEVALAWLEDSGLIHRVSQVSKPGIPLKAYANHSAFKLFVLDVGLLGATADLSVRTLLEKNQLFEEFKGALTEQFVLQQLKAAGDFPICYWSAARSSAEVDFIIQIDGNVVPIEVKAEENLKAKSLKVYFEKFAPNKVVRTSMSDYRNDEWLTNVPLYAIDAMVKRF